MIGREIDSVLHDDWSTKQARTGIRQSIDWWGVGKRTMSQLRSNAGDQ